MTNDDTRRKGSKKGAIKKAQARRLALFHLLYLSVYNEFSLVNFTISEIRPKATPTTVSAAP